MLLDLLPLFQQQPAPAASSGGGRLRAHGPLQRKTLPGAGHLRVEVELHGDPGPVPTITGEGVPLSGGAVLVALSTTGRVLSHTRVVTTARMSATSTTRTTGRIHVTPAATAHLTRIIDPDEWLIFDLPELA